MCNYQWVTSYRLPTDQVASGATGDASVVFSQCSRIDVSIVAVSSTSMCKECLNIKYSNRNLTHM